MSVRRMGDWEPCPNCKDSKDRWLFKVRIENNQVWLFCSSTKACGWKIKLSGDAARVFLPATQK